ERGSGTRFDDDPDVNLNFSRVKEGVWLSRSRFAGHVSLEAASVGGVLYLNGASLVSLSVEDATLGGMLIGENTRPGSGEVAVTTWRSDGALRASMASIDKIIITRAAVTELPQTIDFSGTTYKDLRVISQSFAEHATDILPDVITGDDFHKLLESHGKQTM